MFKLTLQVVHLLIQPPDAFSQSLGRNLFAGTKFFHDEAAELCSRLNLECFVNKTNLTGKIIVQVLVRNKGLCHIARHETNREAFIETVNYRRIGKISPRSPTMRISKKLEVVSGVDSTYSASLTFFSQCATIPFKTRYEAVLS